MQGAMAMEKGEGQVCLLNGVDGLRPTPCTHISHPRHPCGVWASAFATHSTLCSFSHSGVGLKWRCEKGTGRASRDSVAVAGWMSRSLGRRRDQPSNYLAADAGLRNRSGVEPSPVAGETCLPKRGPGCERHAAEIRLMDQCCALARMICAH